ncbi:hypothetical protein A3F02_00420 [Candidatus Curtissbacteria bacterium RIFCSPHIGHO2_12_FULL_38_9b]|uniref:RCK N-terminal domain-containing protein n=2 Tax=Candidatus Curtissiibacteriota TaxID=1752717 RepID=A0A1F5GZ77_9BACT|nr:MAG: hypothetical protein A3A48_02350 [Candidatus Curtissbacteria bacterium RIFCSPLOWO2_01_FULL_37_9]OGD97087.1 MAG: hypothetical protein A3F02_00420 [Candidatus Curtissbacteria bacterium RIFCSPHIGHO2_12_FULL_38_9b]
MENLFFQLATVLVLASIFGIIARLFKQPLIIAYIFTGIVISVFAVFKSFDRAFLDILANFGIAFLLFLVGIELKIEDLKYVGKAAIFTGFGQIFFTALVGFIIVSALGFPVVPAMYIAIALTFSSTVIIVKLLTEKHDLQSLYGKIAVGFLLIQDFVAVLALMFLSGFSVGKTPHIGDIMLIFVKGFFLFIFTYIVSKTILKYVLKLTSTSVELLFISAIAWAFLMAAFAQRIGFSIAIGAFLAGIAIASSPYRIQISARVKPLRDFFIVIFFILLGASMSIGASGVQISHMIILSLFILIGNPLIVLAIMLPLGFRNRTSFLTSVTVAQISEFSLILMAVGYEIGHLTTEMVSLVSGVGIITITLSSYLILYGERIYKFIQKPFTKLFPEKARDPYVLHRELLKDHVILIGAEQMGSDILEFLKSKVADREQIVVVDFNPEIINSIRAAGFNAVFGDISDPEVLEELELGRAKLIIITDPDLLDSALLIKFAKDKNYKGPYVASSYWLHDAIKLYETGADYVVVPETVGGKHISRLLAENWEDLNNIKKQKSKHFEQLLSHKIF